MCVWLLACKIACPFLSPHAFCTTQPREPATDLSLIFRRYAHSSNGSKATTRHSGKSWSIKDENSPTLAPTSMTLRIFRLRSQVYGFKASGAGGANRRTSYPTRFNPCWINLFVNLMNIIPSDRADHHREGRRRLSRSDYLS